MSSVTHISLPKTFDTERALEWFKRFEICCHANGWDNDKIALKLPTLLEGEALAVWLELMKEGQKNYNVTKKKIINAIKPMSLSSLDDFAQVAALTTRQARPRTPPPFMGCRPK